MVETIKAKTLKDILNNPNMSLSERQQLYGVSGVYSNGERHIEKVTIDGNEFTDYKAFSFLREKAYVKEPMRSGAGVIGNLNSYATFLTPRLKIDFSMLSIDSYRLLMTLIYGRNEFIVTCYDIVENKDVTSYGNHYNMFRILEGLLKHAERYEQLDIREKEIADRETMKMFLGEER
jgi:hypothetical protein